jgi:hypothetical protein
LRAVQIPSAMTPPATCPGGGGDIRGDSHRRAHHPAGWLAILRVYFALVFENENIACPLQVADNDIFSGRNLARLLRSAASERPTSSTSLNWPRLLRWMYRLSLPVSMSSRFPVRIGSPIEKGGSWLISWLPVTCRPATLSLQASVAGA